MIVQEDYVVTTALFGILFKKTHHTIKKIKPTNAGCFFVRILIVLKSQRKSGL